LKKPPVKEAKKSGLENQLISTIELMDYTSIFFEKAVKYYQNSCYVYPVTI
jgi:hypothetical protein